MNPPFFVDDVADDERRQEEEAVARHGRLRGNVDLVDGDDLALRRGAPLTCSLTVAPMIMLFRRSPMRIMKQRQLFLTAMTAITALMMRPMMFCMMRTVMAVGQCSVIIRPPKPMVTWTSMEKRKAEMKDLEGDSENIHDLLSNFTI
ncbi:hypothetical protein EYF80_018518 [Liparis tanakae]|uniref:Uncharacterized protein n=1 Tax=Liparis tanakae TaxID=230148 RepID=A0A4Z2I034_9TELE|nr:hypothetical protein EYF80_018518 [Liparis tanakae]